MTNPFGDPGPVVGNPVDEPDRPSSLGYWLGGLLIAVLSYIVYIGQLAVGRALIADGTCCTQPGIDKDREPVDAKQAGRGHVRARTDRGTALDAKQRKPVCAHRQATLRVRRKR